MLRSYQKKELSEVAKALGPQYVDVFYARQTWQSPGGKRKGWKVIIEHHLEKQPKLEWVNTYDEDLTKIGLHSVQFYRNAQGRCIRKPIKR